jgi:hypothetical protein
VAPADSEVSTSGTNHPGSPLAWSRATNLDAQVLGTVNLTGLLVESHQGAPPPQPTPDSRTLVGVPASPALTATVARSFAWSIISNLLENPFDCNPPGTRMSWADADLADARVIISGTPPGGLVALHNTPNETVSSTTTVELLNLANSPHKGVRSLATTQLTAITLFENTANQITIEVVAPPFVEAIATGTAGGALARYNEPILRVLNAQGQVLGVLGPGGETNSGQTVLTIPSVAVLRLGLFNEIESPSGIFAGGSADLLQVEILPAASPTNDVLNLRIAHVEAQARVPLGGVACGGPSGTATPGGGAPPPGPSPTLPPP